MPDRHQAVVVTNQGHTGWMLDQSWRVIQRDLHYDAAGGSGQCG